MNRLWNLTISEYLEICEIARKDGVKEGESIEPYFLAYMKIKGKKPIGATELNRAELIREYVSKGKSVLSFENNTVNLIRKKEEK